MTQVSQCSQSLLIIWNRSRWQQVDGHTFEKGKQRFGGRRHRCLLSALWHLSVKVFQMMTEVGKRSCGDKWKPSIRDSIAGTYGQVRFDHQIICACVRAGVRACTCTAVLSPASMRSYAGWGWASRSGWVPCWWLRERRLRWDSRSSSGRWRPPGCQRPPSR